MKYFITLVLLLSVFSGNIFAQKQKVWIDADTGNEMDDLYAITRLLKDTTVEIVGLSSAHFNNADLLVFEKWNAYNTKGFVTVAESQRLNELILKTLNKSDICNPMGADRQIGRSWGQTDPRASEASRAITEAAKAMPAGQKLDIITLGSLTNVASAVILAPEIISKIRCFSLAAGYNPKMRVWNKNEFNVRNDLNAFDYLLNLTNFNFTIMPVDAAIKLQFNREDTYSRLDEKNETEKILKLRWMEHNPLDTLRIMWDLALVEAYLKPSWAKIITATTPPENVKRNVQVYSFLNEKALADDFWRNLKQ